MVDDEPAIVKLVSMNLEMDGFEVISAYDGVEALAKAREENPDLIILDLMMPGLDGIEVCRALRKTDALTPIMFLTVKDDEVDKVLGLEMGADDYVTKPFSPRELVARVKAMLRRCQVAKAEADSAWEASARRRGERGVLVRGDLRIDLEAHEVTYKDRRIELTPKEFDLLALLARNAGRVLTRSQLLEEVWGYEFLGDSRTVDVHVSHLREKLEDDPSGPSLIETVRGVGYKFKG